MKGFWHLVETLQEEGYDDIKDKNQKYQGTSGWFGITDKYWLTAIVPQKKQAFNAEFIYDTAYKANYILTNPTSIPSGKTNSNSSQFFIGAKEVNVIDGYAKSADINKFDLAIDWGWFYFFTKPLFFIIDYLYKFSGNFGWQLFSDCLDKNIIFPACKLFFCFYGKDESTSARNGKIKRIHKDDKIKFNGNDGVCIEKKKLTLYQVI